MWERRSYKDGVYNDGVSSRCTVKFRGEIPQWPNAIALGVEWDDPARGRHDGDLDGKHYFDVRVPGSGSFIRDTRPWEEPRTFEDAVAVKYLDNPTYAAVQLSREKHAEMVGFDKSYERQSHLDDLKSLSLEACLVHAFAPVNPFTFSSLERLDLSNNLFSNFFSMVSHLSAFPKLRSLRLNGNRFDLRGQTFSDLRASRGVSVKCERVLELEMAYTMVTEDEASIVLSFFPNLAQLSLAHNRLTRIPEHLPDKVRSLDLASNPISSLNNLPSTLRELYLSQTAVKCIEDDDFLPSVLDLRDTDIFSWHNISQIGLKEVKDLQLTHSSDEHVLKRRPYIIARCPQLEKLDGTIITEGERRDAELYTINAVASKKHPALPSYLWDHLIDMYGSPAIPPNKSIRARLISFYIDSDPNPLRIVKDAPLYRLRWLVAQAKGYDPDSFHIKGVTEQPTTENDTYSSLMEVGDLLVDGQRLETVPMPQ